MNGQVVGKGATGNAPGGKGKPGGTTINPPPAFKMIGQDGKPIGPDDANPIPGAPNISSRGGSDPRRETVDSAAVKQTSHTAVNQNVDNSTNVGQIGGPPAPAPSPGSPIVVIPGPPVPNLNGKIAYGTY
jgi:hypothetical protein